MQAHPIVVQVLEAQSEPTKDIAIASEPMQEDLMRVETMA